MIETSRRSLLLGLGAVIAAPAIVRASSLMKVKVYKEAGRVFLSEDYTYYVAPWGSDLNNGTVASPWATIQHAVDQAPPFGDPVTVQLADGTYGEPLSVLGSRAITIKGNEADVGAVMLTRGIEVSDFSYTKLESLSFDLTGEESLRSGMATQVFSAGNNAILDLGSSTVAINIKAEPDTHSHTRRTLMRPPGFRWE